MAVARKIRSALTGLILLLMLVECRGRIHKLTLKNETRFLVQLNTFGFYADGTLDVNMTSLSVPEQQTNYPVGFSLSRSRVIGILPYTAEETDDCPLIYTKSNNGEPLILFALNLQQKRVEVKVIRAQDNILTSRTLETDKRVTREPGQPANEQFNQWNKGAAEAVNTVEKKETDPEKKEDKPELHNTPEEGEPKSSDDGLSTIELLKTKDFNLVLGKVDNSYNFSFNLKIGTLAQGLYNLNFHYCAKSSTRPYSLSVEVTEKNPGGFLSAAEIPLSRLYIGMAGVFLTAALVWVYTLMKHRYSVFKIHWLMAVLAFTKATSLFFRSMNYHFINTEGHPIEGWAVMYYITHLLKGLLLFITLALIGTGWSFDKHILSGKEKKIFMIGIPLQVLANVVYIIIESTEEGSSGYSLWKQILFLVDLICCGAILFPVVWSIRHLQEVSRTDSKEALNLEKLKLFRRYYIMIVSYIYFTRIIAILLKITMPFQWCYEFLMEMSTLILFVLTGYNFRPASSNSYLQLPQDGEDMETDEVLTESGVLEGISKVKKTSNGRDWQNESTP